MVPVLYLTYMSPPVRAVLMTAKAIDLTLEEKVVDFFQSDHLTSEFLQLNPQHTVPTLVDDDGFTIWDSNAIMAYLVSKHGRNDLYPENIQERAIVNQRLHFNSGVSFYLSRMIAIKVLKDGEKFIREKDEAEVVEAYHFLNEFLRDKKWMAGNSKTIADYSLAATVSTLETEIPIDYQKFPNLGNWFEQCENLSEYEANRRGLKEVRKTFRARLSKYK